MTKHTLTLPFLILCLFIIPTANAQKELKADQLIGSYEAISDEAPNNVSHVKISKASNGKYYGEIIWLKVPKYADGKEKIDKLNPQEKLRTRRLIGLKLLNDFKYDASENEWNGGTIYNPSNGKTYNSFIQLDGPDKLKIRGYIGAAWMGLGKTVYWTRLKSN